MITLRQTGGLALLALGLWLGWGSWLAFHQYTSRMPDPDYLAQLQDPVFLVPGLRALLAVLGGLLVLLRRPGGALLGLASALLTAFLAAAIIASGGDVSLWDNHAIMAGVLFVLSLALFLRKRTL